ncbi:transporter substrate-binding domain-containing protein [Dactylosporangium sp. CA-233914]|uniref:transporter substrate-binding domain-containing protein n=1 Tax=Dactylosporangium sp. CA-233914 TaxID=3239934 RepID=UPI003D8DBF7A
MNHTLKFVAPLVASATLVLALSACGSSGDSSTGAAPQGGVDTSAPLYNQVPAQYRKGIKVAVQLNSAPLSMQNENGTQTGEDPELFAALSKQLGIPITVEQTSFENELLGLEQKKYDFVGQTNITAEREQKYTQLAQFKDGYRFAALSTTRDIGNTVMDLCGRKIASQVGDQATDYLNQKSKECTSAGKGAITIIQMPSQAEEYVAVASGRAEAAVQPLSLLAYFFSQKDQQLGKSWKETGPSILPILVGYTFLKDSPLVPVVQQGIQALIDNGTYGSILKKWGLSENAVQKAEVNPAPLAVG